MTPNDPATPTRDLITSRTSVLTSASYLPGQVQDQRNPYSIANKTYRVELFGNYAANSSNFGEGHYFSFLQVTTDGSGNVSFRGRHLACSSLTLSCHSYRSGR